MTLAYAESPHRTQRVKHVHTWEREDLEPMVMSTSSGPKDYLKNQIHMAFDTDPRISRISMVVANMTPFCIFEVDGKSWHDCTGKQVIVSAL